MVIVILSADDGYSRCNDASLAIIFCYSETRKVCILMYVYYPYLYRFCLVRHHAQDSKKILNLTLVCFCLCKAHFQLHAHVLTPLSPDLN